MELVINEWLPEYCKVEEARENKELVKVFLEKFLRRGDILFIRRPSEFLRKIDRYAKHYQSHRDTYSISIITFFIKTILRDSNKCVFIDEDCNLESLIMDKLHEGNYASDMYLFEAASKTVSKLIITTDDKLCRQMHNIANYKVVSLKDFLRQY